MSLGMEAFKTRQKANDGVRLPLYAPDGSATDDWLQVRHVWSDAFILANNRAKRDFAEWMQGKLAERGDPDGGIPDDLQPDAEAFAKGQRIELLASLIAGWSFPEECTPEAAVEFLSDAPQIADKVDEFAASNRHFFGEGSIS